MHGKNNWVTVKVRGWSFLVIPELVSTEFLDICCLPAKYFPPGTYKVNSSINTEVRKFQFCGRNYFLKEYFPLNWKKQLKILRRGERLAGVAQQMLKFGFLTPHVVGIGRKGKNRRVITEAIESAQDVWQVLYPDFKNYRGHVSDGFVYAFGRQIGTLHRCGFFHGDLRWRNILTRREEGEWKFFFIDNDRTVRFRFGIPDRFRIKNLTQVLFSGLLLDWPQSDWETFLKGYFEKAGVPQAKRDRLVMKVEEKARMRLVDRLRRRE